MLTTSKITEIFYSIDNFCLVYEPFCKKQAIISSATGKKRRNRSSKMSLSEVVTITVLFHKSQYRNFKSFYILYVQKHLKSLFPSTVSYNRFVELMQSSLMALIMYLKTYSLGTCSGISFVDSTPIRVCSNKRTNQHKVFDGIANLGKSTMGWFFGFKLHIIVSEQGELIDFLITRANVDDRTPLKERKFLAKIFGKLYADKGYISKKLSKELFEENIQLITGLKSKMKNALLPIEDKLLLRKRSIIETINDQLKNISQIEHSRHRSFANFLTNIIAGLIAYCTQEKKPKIKFSEEELQMLQTVA